MAKVKVSELELKDKLVYIGRTAKVVKGGRRFNFSAIVVVGNGQGYVGYGLGKASEVVDAVNKATESAKKNLTKVTLSKTTIPHEVTVSWDGATVLLKPAPKGTGVIAGSKVRAVLELAGVKDVLAKNLGARNPINQVKATFQAISQLVPRNEIKQRRLGAV